ncbi:MAG: cation:proton antiporter [Planctomycetaceae bacterium]
MLMLSYVLNPFGAGAANVAVAQTDETVAADVEGSDEADHDESHAAGDHDDHGGGGHKDPVSDILLAIVLILFSAKVCGDVFERVGLPAVLGELCVGVVLGNWALLFGGVAESMGYANAAHMFDFLRLTGNGLAGNETAYVIDMLARIGVVLLLFEVGLESRIKDMVSVGVSSMLVAILGVVAPMILGWLVGRVLIPEAGGQVHAFLGACLCATSVGITARVLKDLNRSQDRESKIVLGAAVIDDVLGLIVLAVVSGVIQKGSVEPIEITKIVGLSFGFLAGAMVLGAIQFPRLLFKGASYLRGHGLLVVTALVICFGFAYVANVVQLAPIVGAFAAGLILEGAHYQDANERWKNHELEEAIAPISALLVPIFFVGMGIQVDLASFGSSEVWKLAAGLTIAAIIGKQVCSLGVREAGLNKTAVGLGMIPRGEVGLIFASVGRELRKPDGSSVVDTQTYSALVVMVMITTMVTPPLLKWSMSKSSAQSENSSEG